MNYSKVRFTAVFAVFMLCAGLLFAQNASSDTVQDTQNLSQSQIEESQFTFDGNLDGPAASAPRPVSGFWAFVRMILVLGLVVAVIYFIFRLMKKTIEPGADNDPFLRKVAGITLGPGKSVQIVTLIDKCYILGVSDDSVNLIAEVDDKELINAMNLHSDKTTNQFKAKNFAEVLEMFMPRKDKGNSASGAQERTAAGKVFDTSTQDLINSLRRKRIADDESGNGSGEEQ